MTSPLRAEIEANLSPAIDHSALRAVDRAAAELRRGDPIVLEARDGMLVVRGAEGATSAALERLAALGTRPALAVTAMRAAVLGFDTRAPAMTLSRPTGLDAAAVRELAGPDFAEKPDLSGIRLAEAEPGGRVSAAVALAKLARLLPAVLVAEPAPADAPDAAGFAARHDLLWVRASDVFDYQTHSARSLTLVGEARVPLADAENARVVAFRPADGGVEHLAILIGEPDPYAPVLARIHSECFTGDLLGSLRCDCGDQLRGAIAEISRQGSGVVIYLAQEGRGIGLVNKLRAYRLQDQGFDTVDANERLGFDADERVYLPAAEMLRRLGFSSVRLMTNNPDKLRQLARCGIQVAERVPHVFPTNGHNEGYLRTKAERSGHMF
jgi:GTP cyclohydrolase II